MDCREHGRGIRNFNGHSLCIVPGKIAFLLPGGLGQKFHGFDRSRLREKSSHRSDLLLRKLGRVVFGKTAGNAQQSLGVFRHLPDQFGGILQQRRGIPVVRRDLRKKIRVACRQAALLDLRLDAPQPVFLGFGPEEIRANGDRDSRPDENEKNNEEFFQRPDSRKPASEPQAISVDIARQKA